MSPPDLLPVRTVVIALAVGFVGSIVAITFLASTQTPIPDALADIPVFSGGALAGLLAKTQQTPTADPVYDAPPPIPVTVEQPVEEPIPVEQIDP